MLKNVLVATDLKERGFCELEAFGAIPPEKVGTITLFHVIDERKGKERLDPEQKERLEKQFGLLQQKGFHVEKSVERGIPFDSIVEKTNGMKATLLVMGREEHPLRAKFLGETAYRVLELCPVPIWFCHREADKAEGNPFSHVMIGTDFSDHAYNAFRSMKALAGELKETVEKVTLLHVHERSNVELLEKVVARRRIEEIIELERSRLEEMSEGLRQAGVPEVKISMRTGRVVDEILSAIEEQEPGLVILGTQGAGRSEMLRVGSCAFRVSQKAPASVVLIPFGRSWELPF